MNSSPYMATSTGVLPGAYFVTSENIPLVHGEPGNPVVLSASAASSGEPWFIVPDDKTGADPTRKYLFMTAKETFLAKVVDIGLKVDFISTVADRSNALNVEILPGADDGKFKLAVDGYFLTRVADDNGSHTEGRVELRPPGISGDEASQLWKLTAVQGGTFTQFDCLL